jgi:hypothetical protein
MSEQWLTFREAVEIVRAHLGASIGRSEAVTNAARASGEVRFQNPADPVLLLADDGLVGMSLRPGGQDKAGIAANGRPTMHRAASTDMSQISKDDLLDWLRRQQASSEPDLSSPDGEALGTASKKDIRQEIHDVYSNASTKPPNIKELPKVVRPRLDQRGLDAADRHI